MDIALHCLRDRGIERPLMAEVVKRIGFALKLQEKAEAAAHLLDGNTNTPAASGFELDSTIYPQLSDSVNKLWPAPAPVWVFSDSVPNFDIDSMAYAR